jgi:hypothetical protein
MQRLLRTLVLFLTASLCAAALPRTNGDEIAPQIPRDDRIRLAEAFRLGEELQEQVWKGWSEAPFAVLLVTSDYEFLIRHPRPSDDFTKLGRDELLRSDVYFRKRVHNPRLLATFPAVGGISTIVVGQAEATGLKSTRWVATLLHEHFHQWQDSQPNSYADANALGLSRGDQTGMWMLNYPFPYEDAGVIERFGRLSRTLAEALRARGAPEFAAKLAVYRAAREAFEKGLASDDYKYFSFQLWKEGVARYTEIQMARLAFEKFHASGEFAALEDYQPFETAAREIDDRIFATLDRPRLAENKRVNFYAIGAGEALLLDAANPGWKHHYLAEKFYLEKYYAEPAGR